MSASDHYAWQQAQYQAVNKEPPAWGKTLVKVFSCHKCRYATRRLQVALHRKGYRVGWQRLRAVMRRRGLLVTLAQGVHAAHNRLHARAALRPEPAARLAQTHSGQSGPGQRHHVPSPSQRRLGLPVRFSGHGQQAGRRLANRGHDARRVGDPCLATGRALAGPVWRLLRQRPGSNRPKVLDACGSASKRRSSNCAGGPFLPT